jgi:hypothetical protein
MVNKVLSINERQNAMLRVSYSHIKLLLEMAVFCILLGTLGVVNAQESKSALTSEDVNALIPIVEAAEEKPFLNLRVESERWVETKDDLADPCEAWQRTLMYVSCTAWFGGGTKGRARIDVHKEVLKWSDGTAPYAESSYSVGFDGQYGRVTYHTTGYSGKTFLRKEGKLLPDAPEQLRDPFLASCTGAQYTTWSFFDDDGTTTFSQLFRTSTTPAALQAKAFECAIEEFQGVQCIKFGSGEQPWGRQTFWFDPSRGFALLRYKKVRSQSGGEQLTSRIEVTELKEVAPGIWWPMEVISVARPYESGEPWRRIVYRASSVVANDPNFDESIFTVPFPDGYLIDDQVASKKYTVGKE